MRSARARYRHSVLVLFLAGTAGMVASVMLQLLYQNFFGSLYREIGLLVALFMAGLTLGGIAGNRWGSNTVQSLTGRCAVAALLFALFFLFLEFAVTARSLSWALGRVFEYRGFFFVATVVAGLLTGVLFPLTGRLAVVSGRDPGRTGGVLECTDHIGACLGAFLVGIVLVPVSGMIATLKVFRVILFFAGVSLALSALTVRSARSKIDGDD
jgi:spermidine synthase